MRSYSEYYRLKSDLEDLMPSKRDIGANVPEIVRIKAQELRLVVLGALAELDQESREDDD